MLSSLRPDVLARSLLPPLPPSARHSPPLRFSARSSRPLLAPAPLFRPPSSLGLQPALLPPLLARLPVVARVGPVTFRLSRPGCCRT